MKEEEMGGTCNTHGDYRISEEKVPLRRCRQR
jgi:hypothetical protein